jgi:hypothetical protein
VGLDCELIRIDTNAQLVSHKVRLKAHGKHQNGEDDPMRRRRGDGRTTFDGVR